MKYFIIVCFSIAFFSGCKKTDEVKQRDMQLHDSTNIPVQDRSQIEEALKHLDKSKMKTPQGALEVFANLPEGGPIPPPFLPAKDISVLSKTDSTVTLTYTAGMTGQKMKAVMKKVFNDSEKIWGLGSVTPTQ